MAAVEIAYHGDMTPALVFTVAFRRSWRAAGCAVVLAGLAGFGCSRYEPPPKPKPEFHVVLLVASGAPAPVQAALEGGLRGIESDLFAATAVRLVEPGQPLIETLRRTGREAPALVFCHMPGEEHVVVEEAAAYQDTQFVIIPGRAVGSNVSGVVFRVDGAAYVAGAALAAGAGERPLLLVHDTVGTGLHGLEAGFRAGVASVGGELLPAADPDAALGEIGAGRVGGVFFAGFGAPAAVREACAAAALPLVTVSLGRSGAAPPERFGSVVVRMGEAVRRLARERWAGTLEGRIYSYTLGSGVVDFEVETRAPVPKAVQNAMDSARADVLAGIAEIEDLRM